MLLGSRGLPREAPEAHEGSQEAPKELQDLKNKGSKKEPKIYQFFDEFCAHFGSHFGARMGSKIGPKLVCWGPFFDPLFLRSWSSLDASWEPSWASGASLGRPLDLKKLKKQHAF